MNRPREHNTEARYKLMCIWKQVIREEAYHITGEHGPLKIVLWQLDTYVEKKEIYTSLYFIYNSQPFTHLYEDITKYYCEFSIEKTF